MSTTQIETPKEKPEYKGYSNDTIPKLIHFIWVGKPIPVEYLIHVVDIANMTSCHGYQVKLWTDNEKHTVDTIKKVAPGEVITLSSSHKILSLEILNINIAFSQLRTDSPFTNSKDTELLITHMARELVGFTNPAAFADLFRYIALYDYGGIYIDIDWNFVSNPYLTMDPDSKKPLFGIKISSHYWLNNEKGIINQLNNDYIACVPKHAVLKNILQTCLANYKQLDKQKFKFEPFLKEFKQLPKETTAAAFQSVPVVYYTIEDEYQYPIDEDEDDFLAEFPEEIPEEVPEKPSADFKAEFMMDAKRWPYSKFDHAFQELPVRIALTLHTSGPEVLKGSLNNFLADIKTTYKITNEQYAMLYSAKINTSFDRHHARVNGKPLFSNIDIPGVEATPKCDGSWLNKKKKQEHQKSFDTDALPAIPRHPSFLSKKNLDEKKSNTHPLSSSFATDFYGYKRQLDLKTFFPSEKDDEYMMTALHYAAAEGNAKAVNFLSKQSTLNTMIKGTLHEENPLHLAIAHRHFHLIRCLLNIQSGTMAKLQSNWGHTPLHYLAMAVPLSPWPAAIRSAIKDLIALSSLSLRDINGKTALDLAIERNNTSIIELLQPKNLNPHLLATKFHQLSKQPQPIAPEPTPSPNQNTTLTS